jgi:hypothetical protein
MRLRKENGIIRFVPEPLQPCRTRLHQKNVRHLVESALPETTYQCKDEMETAMAKGHTGERPGHPKRSRMLALTALALTLAPSLANSSRIWRATECTVCAVTERATHYYEVIRFVYHLHQEVEGQQADNR